MCGTSRGDPEHDLDDSDEEYEDDDAGDEDTNDDVEEGRRLIRQRSSAMSACSHCH